MSGISIKDYGGGYDHCFVSLTKQQFIILRCEEIKVDRMKEVIF